MTKILVATKTDNGLHQKAFVAHQIEAGDISMPLEDGALRDEIEIAICFLRDEPAAQTVDLECGYRIGPRY